MPRHEKPRPVRKPTRDDLLDKEAFDHAARGVIEQLRRAYANNRARQIGQLNREEIQNIAIGAVSYWIVKRCEQWAKLEQAGTLDDLILRRYAEDVADLL